MSAKRLLLPWMTFLLLTLPFSAHSQELHRWVDTDGNIHYTTRLESVPEQYRDQVVRPRTQKNMKRTPLAAEKSKEIQNLSPVKEPEKKKQIPAPVSVKKVEAPVQPTQKPQKKSNFILKSSAFANKRKIPSKYARRSGNVSPPLTWENPPEGTKSYVLTLTEPEAPGGPFTHWVIYNISVDQANLPEGVPRKVSVNGAQQTRNDFNGVGYGGPESTGGVRRYLFRLVALDVEKIKKPREETLQEHALGEATLVAFYP